MTPPWTDASTDFETGFDQNDAEKLECCVESTVRCYYPEDYVNCYPWPEEYAVTDRTLRSIKCVDGDDRESSVKYDGSDKCVVTGDRGGFYVTPSGFGPTQQGASDNGLQVEFTRYAVQALSNSTKGSDLLAAGRIKWTFDGRLEAILLAGTNGAMLHLVPTISEEASDPEEFVFQHTGTVDDMIYISEYDRDSELFTKQTMDDYYVVVLGATPPPPPPPPPPPSRRPPTAHPLQAASSTTSTTSRRTSPRTDRPSSRAAASVQSGRRSTSCRPTARAPTRATARRAG